jgi:hypothetical protein
VKVDPTSSLLGLAREWAEADSNFVMFTVKVDITRADEAARRGIHGTPLAFQSNIASVANYQDRVAPSALLLAISLAVIGIAVDTASLQRRLSTRRTVSLRAPAQVGGTAATDRIDVVAGATRDMVGLPVTVPQARRVSVLTVDEDAQTVTLTAKLVPVTGGDPVAVASGTAVTIGDAVNDIHFLTPDRIGASVGASIGTTWLVITLAGMYHAGEGMFKAQQGNPRFAVAIQPGG